MVKLDHIQPGFECGHWVWKCWTNLCTMLWQHSQIYNSKKNTSSVIATHTYFFTILPCMIHSLHCVYQSQQYQSSPGLGLLAKHISVSRLESETFHWVSQVLCNMQHIPIPSDSRRGTVFPQTQTDAGSYTWRWKSLFSMAKCSAWLNGNAILTRLNGAKSLLPATRNSCFGLFFFFFLSKI